MNIIYFLEIPNKAYRYLEDFMLIILCLKCYKHNQLCFGEETIFWNESMTKKIYTDNN